mgnify:CR=1 FL=1
MNKTDYKDMWVFIERDGDSVLPVSLELCSETRRLCDASGEKLVAVIVGSISDGELQRVLDCGVDKIIHVTGTGYDYFNNDAYTNLFTVLCRKYRPTAVMVGGTINGRDFAPRFAARLGTGCTSDATELVWDPKTTDIEFVEPAVGGKMMAVITVPVARPQVGTIRPGTFKCVPCGARAHEVIEEHIDFPVADIRTEILDFRADDLDERLNVFVPAHQSLGGAEVLRAPEERDGGKLADAVACAEGPALGDGRVPARGDGGAERLPELGADHGDVERLAPQVRILRKEDHLEAGRLEHRLERGAREFRKARLFAQARKERMNGRVDDGLDGRLGFCHGSGSFLSDERLQMRREPRLARQVLKAGGLGRRRFVARHHGGDARERSADPFGLLFAHGADDALAKDEHPVARREFAH